MILNRIVNNLKSRGQDSVCMSFTTATKIFGSFFFLDEKNMCVENK